MLPLAIEKIREDQRLIITSAAKDLNVGKGGMYSQKVNFYETSSLRGWKCNFPVI